MTLSTGIVETEQRLADKFDYEAEDRLIEAYRESLAKLLYIYEAPVWHHPYPHPKKELLSRDERGR